MIEVCTTCRHYRSREVLAACCWVLAACWGDVGGLMVYLLIVLPLSLFTRGRRDGVIVRSDIRATGHPGKFVETFGCLFGPDSVSAACVDPGHCGCTLVLSRFAGCRCCDLDDDAPRSRQLQFSPGPHGGVNPCFN